MADTDIILEGRDITKIYGGVEALNKVTFKLPRNEVVALLGDNGAGKSTLIKVLSGAISPSSGQVLLEGKPVQMSSTKQAKDLGIETVYQDLALCPHLDPVNNLFLGREIMRRGLMGALGFMNRRAMREQSIEAFNDLGATVRTLTEPVGTMSGGQKQSIAVARASAWASKIIFLDEPTAALDVVQTHNVLELIKRVRDKGIGVVLISHSMPEVLAVSDDIQVMRRGRRVATYQTADTNIEELVATMTGKFDEGVAA